MSRAERSGREARRAARQAQAHGAFKLLESHLPYTEVLNQEGLEKIHQASMRLLSDYGILILDYPEALETFRQNGAKIDGDKVFIDEATLMNFVKMAPPSFTQLARNSANNLTIGRKNIVFAPVYGPPYVSDLDRGRRQSTLEDFNNFAKLTYMIPELHSAGGTLCEPNDIDVKERHLDMLMAHITLSDKAFMGSVTHKDNARDTVTMSEILFGKDAIRENPATVSLVNVSSPLRYDDRMLGALQVYAEARQAVLLASFIVVGAMSPTTLAATLAQQNAETLFGIAYAQMLNPGTPIIQGNFLPTIDMKSGAPSFGTPEASLALYASAQMARYYNLPFRSGGNLTASRIPDAQAAYESANTFWPTVQANTNFVLHAAGWLEGGLVSGYEKLIMDAELLGMATTFAKGIELNDDTFAWEAYDEIGPGGHFLGAAHTMKHYDTAFYQHKVFNMDNFEKWRDEGSEDTYKRANSIWKKMLSEYQAPALDDAKKEELEAFIAQRREELRSGTLRKEWRG
jgi:trimethylamine---corrinoid protein Co-methyltransferase